MKGDCLWGEFDRGEVGRPHLRNSVTGAGAAAQNAIGTAVTGGLLSATFIDLIFIPFFFVLIMRIWGRNHLRHRVVM
jgi:stage V sporulation protein SpoVS